MSYIKKEVIYDAISFDDLANYSKTAKRDSMSPDGFRYKNIYIEQMFKERFKIYTKLIPLLFDKGEYLIIGDDGSINVISEESFKKAYIAIE